MDHTFVLVIIMFIAASIIAFSLMFYVRQKGKIVRESTQQRQWNSSQRSTLLSIQAISSV